MILYLPYVKPSRHLNETNFVEQNIQDFEGTLLFWKKKETAKTDWPQLTPSCMRHQALYSLST
jgi:hypothetical protein